MKRALSLFAMACLVVSVARAAEVFSDDFETREPGSIDGQGPWSVINREDKRDGVVTEGINSSFSDGNRILQVIRKIKKDNYNYVVLNFDEIASGEPFVVTWDWMAATHSAGAANPMFSLYDGQTRMLWFLVHHNTNQLRFYEGGGEGKDGTDLGGGSGFFDPNIWYRFRLAVDPKTFTYGLKVWKEGDDSPIFNASGIQFENPMSGCTSMRFSFYIPPEAVFVGGYYFDNITVQVGAE